MTLRERFDADLKEAMRAKDQVRVDTVRAIKSAIKYKEVEGEAKTLDDAGIIRVITSELKKRREASEQFRANNRPELADKEDREASLLTAYLPQQMSEAEITTIVDAAIAESGAKTPKEMGAVMKLVQPKGSAYRLTPDMRLSRRSREGEPFASGLEATDKLLGELAGCLRDA